MSLGTTRTTPPPRYGQSRRHAAPAPTPASAQPGLYPSVSALARSWALLFLCSLAIALLCGAVIFGVRLLIIGLGGGH